MNAMAFERLIGRNLVAVTCDSLSHHARVNESGRFYLEITGSGLPRSIFELRAREADKNAEWTHDLWTPDVWMVEVTQLASRPEFCVSFFFGLFPIESVRYYASTDLELNDRTASLDCVDLILLTSKEGKRILIGFSQFQVVSEVALWLEEEAIDECLSDESELTYLLDR